MEINTEITTIQEYLGNVECFRLDCQLCNALHDSYECKSSNGGFTLIVSVSGEMVHASFW